MLPAMARQRLRPLKNTALHEAITTAGWTLAGTAKAVNGRRREQHPDDLRGRVRSALARWRDAPTGDDPYRG
ncbi:hypothetical protein GCM10023191_022790 [Actinoallomurus oryzae]|uniref:Uncharacterized protein n=1 Tax=Actinoallomurus oryzae TaxID=502180 RepID=A0ABP8PS66_9ACTN